MTEIIVKVCGDVWCNAEEVEKALHHSDPQTPLILDLRAEGPSLHALGILAMLHQHCRDTGRQTGTIKLVNSPNNREKTPYTNTHTGISHFFAMSVRYWQPWAPTCHLAHRFALFIGRSTVARCAIMYDIWCDPDLSDHFKLSTMSTVAPPIWQPAPQWRIMERIEDWMTSDRAERMRSWWKDHRPGSVDNTKVQDQYDPDKNTNLSLLDVYAQFHVELVCETYTLGDSFFPTEKTVRPIMAMKPMLIYAAPDFLARLRDLGFRTWHDVWDESYDQLEGAQRWQAMRAVIHSLCGMDQAQFRDTMHRARDIAMHNRQCLADLVLTDRAHALSQIVIT